MKTYSSGMFVRLGFSIAAHLDADVLLIDEVLAVGDEAFQRKCLRRMSERIASGTTIVLVSHDAAAIERVCERVVVLDGGRVVFDGPTAEGLLHYHRLMGTEHGAGESVRRERPADVEVVDVELRNAGGRSTHVFRSGEPLQVAITVRIEQAAPAPSLRLEIRSQDGTQIFSTTTDLITGARQLVFEIPALALLGGDYDLSLGAGDGPVNRTVRFSVAHESGAEGIVDLRGRWRERAPLRAAQ